MTNYTTGTITLTNGSTAVTGTGTAWQTALIVGGVIYPQASGNPLPIASVDSNTEITAATEWTGATGTYAYAIARQDDKNRGIANAIALADYIAKLGKPALAAIAGLEPSADEVPFYSGSGSADLATLTAFARTLLDDADASTARATLEAQKALDYSPVDKDGDTMSGELATTATNSFRMMSGGYGTFWRNDGSYLHLMVTNQGDAEGSYNSFRPLRVDLDTGVARINGDAKTISDVSISGLARVSGDAVYSHDGYYFLSHQSGGRLAMNTNNDVEFHWGGGFYYRIDGNSLVLINSSPSDARFKEKVDEHEVAGGLDILNNLSPVRWAAKKGIPVYLPEGDRLGFFAQDLQAMDPALVQELPIPEADEDAEQQTYLALSDDAEVQLIAHLWRAVQSLSARVAELEDA